jgi:hypothetical protein
VRRAILLGLAALALVACGDKKPSIATLTKADGPVEKEPGGGSWEAAKVGTKFHLGDAVRTADGGAGLEIAGGAQIAMQPHTILRFGSKGNKSQISVELGAIELSGTGDYGLDIGDVKLSKGTVRITAKGKGQGTVELLIGDAQVSTVGGTNIDLVVGQVVDLSLEDIDVKTIDAGVADAGVPIDAPEVASADEATIEIKGIKAEVQAPGETGWKTLPAGAGILAKGSKLKLGNGTSAKVTAKGTTLDMGVGSRMVLGDNLEMSFETGSARASVGPGAQGTVKIPGGNVAVKGGAQGGGETKLDTNARETRVTVNRGGAKLSGGNGGELEMNRGESATLAKNGTIRVIEAIPNYFDFQLTAGETLTLHDPKGSTAVRFAFGGKCAEGGFIEMDKDAKYRTAKVSGGKDGANMMVGGGGWAYRLRCSTASGDTAAVASGRIVVTRDSGTRRLLKEVDNDIDPDGRNYRVSYQSSIPNIRVRIKGGGGPFTLHVAQGGVAQSFNGPGPKITIPGSKLKEGTYTYWIERNGVKDAKVSTLTIDFDNTAPQVYIESPAPNKPWGNEIDVRGAVLPGWVAAVDAVTIPIDKQRRFSAKVGKPSGGLALAIKLSHPQRGVHYYLRRGK